MKAGELCDLIRDDRSHGSTALALLAIAGIRDLAQEGGEEVSSGQLMRLIAELRELRPSMVALDNLLGQLQRELVGLEGEHGTKLLDGVRTACESLLEQVRQSQTQVACNMLALVEAHDVIMTHSISSTVQAFCQALATRHPGASLIVTESRPGNEGEVLAAFAAGLGLSVTYITEAQIDLLMPRATKVMLGADAVLSDGSVINKSGSTLMALSARYRSVPCYVCAESFKRSKGDDYRLERMDPAELGIAIEGVEVSNVYFERVPAELITRWICE